METCGLSHSVAARKPHKYPLYLMASFLALLFVVTLGPHESTGRPTTTTTTPKTRSVDTEDGELDSFFDSQRHSIVQQKQMMPPEEGGNANSRTMIVRVIVTSSSSSSSSSQESPDYRDAPFTDFEFPVGSTTTTTTTEATTENSPPSPTPRKDVEDIFSAFYKAFSQNSGHSPIGDASHNVERFQLFYPNAGGSSEPKSPFQRDFGQEQDKKDNFEVTPSTTSTMPKFSDDDEQDERTVIKAVSSSSSSSSSSTAINKTSTPQWGHLHPPEQRAEKVVAVKSVSTSTSSRQDSHSHPYNLEHTNSQQIFQSGHSPTTITSTAPVPGLSYRTTRRRQRPRQRHKISVSASTSTNDFSTTSNDPQALHQYPTSTTTTTTTTSKPKPSWKPQVWAQPEKQWGQQSRVWSEPERQWGEQSKVWSEPAKNWGVPEQNWGHSPSTTSTSTTSTTSTTPKPSPTTRRPRYISRTTKFPKITKHPRPSPPVDEDYPQDAGVMEDEPEEPGGGGGNFVVLGEDSDESVDSIDGSFDHHLGIPRVSPRPISLEQFKTFNFSYYHTFKHLNLSNLANQSDPSFSNSSDGGLSSTNISSSLQIPTEGSGGDENMGNKFGYVLEGSNVRRYRVEERTPDGFIVGEYGVLNNQNAFLRGVRYTADGTINPRLIHEALMKFLSLRRR